MPEWCTGHTVNLQRLWLCHLFPQHCLDTFAEDWWQERRFLRFFQEHVSLWQECFFLWQTSVILVGSRHRKMWLMIMPCGLEFVRGFPYFQVYPDVEWRFVQAYYAVSAGNLQWNILILSAFRQFWALFFWNWDSLPRQRWACLLDLPMSLAWSWQE